eukprot:TRINITY_DN14461_c0_g1_i1.p1 TRINITY_DN14461_c0_g1~~TRINITY_DN14461_c0_g1_i1.p1  ORF type:complete len:232 (+),score=43.75 TRINITY_DN14461_c0_g1_i1:116-811(+)
MQRGLVGSEMCIRDRYQRRVHGKTPGFRYLDDIKLDNKVASLVQLSYSSFANLSYMIYPRTYSVSTIIDPNNAYGTFLTQLDSKGEEIPTTSICKPVNRPSSTESMSNKDAYLIASGEYIFIYVPKEVNETILYNVFGKESFDALAKEAEVGLPYLETPESEKIRNVIDCIRREKGGAYQSVKIIPAGHILEKKVMTEFLVEDCRNPKKEFSHIQFLIHIHKLVMAKLSSV